MEELTPSGQTTGILDIKVFGANEAEPISNAKVTISELVKDASGQDVPGNTLAVVETGDTGNAPSVELPAPPSGSDIPYNSYILSVEAPGAQPKIIQGVQVFPSGPKKNRALQHVQLSPAPVPVPPASGPFPLFEISAPAPMDLIPMTPTIEVIPPHSSVEEPSREPQRDAGVPIPTPIPDPDVGIPDQITVHMGRPEQRVEDKTVSILDYFRKVASKEVDPDYHVEAIRANVIAIMSYTLNRVYTEFYKWKGYDFDITGVNVDQVFIPHYTMQTNIVNVVDDIFKQFIGKKRFKSPILTRYGRTPVPDTLHQPEADRLARSGKDHIQILHHFYNRKFGPIEKRTATPVGRKFQTYPGRDLKEGDRGSDVQYLQRRLKSLEKNFWAIRVIGLVEDGVFGPKTTKAVRVFEREILGIPATGIVTERLWNRLSEYYWPRVPEDRHTISPNGHWAASAGYLPEPAGYWAAPTGYHTAPTGHYATPTGYQAIPSGHYAAPTGYRAVPTGHYAAPTGYWVTPTGYWVAPTGYWV